MIEIPASDPKVRLRTDPHPIDELVAVKRFTFRHRRPPLGQIERFRASAPRARATFPGSLGAKNSAMGLSKDELEGAGPKLAPGGARTALQTTFRTNCVRKCALLFPLSVPKFDSQEQKAISPERTQPPVVLCH